MDWLDSYYDALEFFYEEPQHLRAKTEAALEIKRLEEFAKKTKRRDQVLAHLRGMEVTLNQNIKQFFLLAPATFKNALFEGVFGKPGHFKEMFELQGREVDGKFRLQNCMQPDFLFISRAEAVSIEMKIKHKCSVDQVLKYALLGLAVELQQENEKQHYLILLGPGKLPEQFPERFSSCDELTAAVKESDLRLFLTKKQKPKRFREAEERLREIVENMQVRFLSYKHLSDILKQAAPLQVDRSTGAEVYRNLINGLCSEIDRRQLARDS